MAKQSNLQKYGKNIIMLAAVFSIFTGAIVYAKDWILEPTEPLFIDLLARKIALLDTLVAQVEAKERAKQPVTNELRQRIARLRLEIKKLEKKQ